jgi:hypothetical protein
MRIWCIKIGIVLVLDYDNVLHIVNFAIVYVKQLSLLREISAKHRSNFASHHRHWRFIMCKGLSVEQ